MLYAIMPLVLSAYVGIMIYYSHKSQKVVDKVLNCKPEGYPYVSRYKGDS